MYHSVNCLDVRKATCEASPVTQSCLTLCNPMDCSLPGSSVHGIFQAGVLEWVAISFSRRSSQPKDWTQVSCAVGRCFTIWATREVQKTEKSLQIKRQICRKTNLSPKSSWQAFTPQEEFISSFLSPPQQANGSFGQGEETLDGAPSSKRHWAAGEKPEMWDTLPVET